MNKRLKSLRQRCSSLYRLPRINPKSDLIALHPLTLPRQLFHFSANEELRKHSARCRSDKTQSTNDDELKKSNLQSLREFHKECFYLEPVVGRFRMTARIHEQKSEFHRNKKNFHSFSHQCFKQFSVPALALSPLRGAHT